MAVKPETQLIGNVHKGLDAADDYIYYEKTHNPYRSGIPDVYYDYPGYDLWVEYKFMDKVPKQLCLRSESKPPVSRLQRHWIERAARNGRQVLVVIGFGKGSAQRYLVIRPYELIWDHSVPREKIEPRLIDRNRLVELYLDILRNGWLAQTYRDHS